MAKQQRKDDVADFFDKLFQGTQQRQSEGSSIPAPPAYDPRKDCEKLRAALQAPAKSAGAEPVLVSILCRRPLKQRLQIVQTYHEMYGKDLEADIVQATSGNYEKVLVRLLKTPEDLAALELNEGIKGAGTNEETLIEIIWTGTNAELTAIKKRFQEIYKKDLAKEVEEETSGNFMDLMIALLSCQRNEMQVVDAAAATADARRLYEAGEGKVGTDERVFIFLLATRSYAQLQAIFEAYRRDFKVKNMSDVIQDEFSGDIADGLIALIAAAHSKPTYFAERLRFAMSDRDLADRMLVRIITWRCDIDLSHIKTEYQRMYARSLAKDVSEACTGEYKTALMALLGN